MATNNEKAFTADEVRAMIEETTKNVAKSIFAEFGPVLQSVALTPEKLREAQKPYVAPEELARKNHEQKKWREQEAERLKLEKNRKDSCPHQDANGAWAIRITHNYPDKQTRGICPMCQIYIEPAHWDYVVETLPDGSLKEKAVVVPAHPLYGIVQMIDAKS